MFSSPPLLSPPPYESKRLVGLTPSAQSARALHSKVVLFSEPHLLC